MSWSKGKHNEGLVCPPLVIPNFVLSMVVAFAPLRREPAFDQIGVVLRFSWQHNSNLASFHIVTMYRYQESRERLEVMAISVNSRTSEFRKWSEAQELRKLDDTRGEAVLAGGIASPDVDQAVMTPDQAPQRPWVVPGAGKL